MAVSLGAIYIVRNPLDVAVSYAHLSNAPVDRVIDQMAMSGDPNRVRLALYPGGHMFYSRPDSRTAFRQDVKGLFGAP